jgi:hypothetical protein
MLSVIHDKINSSAFISIKYALGLFIGIASILLLVAFVLKVADLPLGIYMHGKGLISYSFSMLLGAMLSSVAIWFVSKILKVTEVSVFYLLSIPAYFVLLSLPREASTVLITLITGVFTWTGFLIFDNRAMLEYRELEDETI